MFTEDDIDQSLLEVTIESEKKENPHTNTSTSNQSTDKNEVSTPQKRMSLFDTMQAIEGDQNPTVSNTLLGNQRRNSLLNDTDASMDEDKSDPATELKKKITKKITDYFSKKSI